LILCQLLASVRALFDSFVSHIFGFRSISICLHTDYLQARRLASDSGPDQVWRC
jgi:hypothetical protein